MLNKELDFLPIFTPLENPAIYGGDEKYKGLIPLFRKGRVKAPSFLTGFTICLCLGICLVKLWHIHFLLLYTGCWILVILNLVFLKQAKAIWLFLILSIFLGGLILKNSYELPRSHILKLTLLKTQRQFQLKGIVIDAPQFTKHYRSFILLCEELILENKIYKVTGKVLVRAFGKENISYGQRVLLKGRLSPPYGHTYRDYLLTQQIYSVFNVSYNTPISILGFGRSNPLKRLSYKIRDISRNVYFKYLPKTQAGIFSAVLLGDRSQINPYYQRLFVQTGAVHILAISGLHIGIIVFVLNLFLKTMGFKKRMRYVLITVCLIFYCILTGMRPSVIRATIMAVILLGGFFLKREMQISQSLAFAALVILTVNPRQFFNIGFQLSFASVIAIVYLYPQIKRRLFLKDYKFKILTFISDAFCLSLSVWLGLLVMIAYYFKIISPVAVLANILIVPSLSIVISMGIVLIFAGILLPAIAPIFSTTANLTLIWLIYIIEFFNRLPLAYFYLP